MNADMNAWQERLHDVLFGQQLINPKRVSFRLHKHSDYLSDVCRRERVDPFAIFNAILQEAESYAQTDLARFSAITRAVFPLLFYGTNWYIGYAPAVEPTSKLGDLRDQISALLQDLAGAVESLCDIERDRQVNESDDPDIVEFDVKSNRLCALLSNLQREIHRRRNAGVST